MKPYSLSKYLLIINLCLLITYPNFSFSQLPEIPLLKPSDSIWRINSDIAMPINKPDPALLMMAKPSDLEAPILRPDPLSIYPEAKKNLTEMVFLKTNLLTQISKVQKLTLKKDEGINPLLRRGGFSSIEAHKAIIAIENIANLRRLPIGLKVDLLSPKDNSTGAISFQLSKEYNIYAILGNDLNWTAIKARRPIKIETKLISGEIKSSLYLAAKEVNVPEDVLMSFVKLMGYSVDFQRQIQPRDKFKIMFDQSYDVIEDKRIGLEKILFAKLNVSGRDLSFYRFVTNDGVFGYYDESGQSARKALMRTPINGARLSSGFGMRRHPVKGFSAMHKGVDFGAPSGTPIFAAGDGILEKVGWINGYGRYILIRHNSKYKTAYAHLKGWTRNIRRGARVSQGQVIGYVGSSGRSTGPHLHYEIIINGRQVNPLGVRMPSGKPISRLEMKRFHLEVENIKLTIKGFEKN